MREQLINSNKYGIKCPYTMNPIGLCVHNTANDASASNEVAYMGNNNNEVSFHVAIDDKEAIKAIPFTRNAWAAGDGGNGTGNRNYIHIEICYSKSGGDRFVKAEKLAAKEIAGILKSYNWGIDKVKKHQDFSGKYCPHRTLDMGWQRFLNMIQAELTQGSATTQTNSNNSIMLFSEKWYLYNNKDVAKDPVFSKKPYEHYEKLGKSEGRAPLPPIPKDYCEGDYLELNKDVANVVGPGKTFTSGLHHYLEYGFSEGRRIKK